MQDVIREPVELIDEDLDEVAGGSRHHDVTVNNIGVGAVFGGFYNNNVGVGQNNGIILVG